MPKNPVTAPIHPGDILPEEFISAIVNETRGITADTARLELNLRSDAERV